MTVEYHGMKYSLNGILMDFISSELWNIMRFFFSDSDVKKTLYRSGAKGHVFFHGVSGMSWDTRMEKNDQFTMEFTMEAKPGLVNVYKKLLKWPNRNSGFTH